MITTTRHFHTISTGAQSRRLSYLQTGGDQPLDVFFCLPGLLETSESFEPLVDQVQAIPTCTWISIDYCGRGESDPLPIDQTYAMSVYLEDIHSLINHWLAGKKAATMNFHLIGTSMGGLLAMHLVHRNSFNFKSLILNDIGLVLYWPALANLYLKIKQNPDVLKKLRLDSRIVREVQKPQHFDLPCKMNFEGMQFHDLLDQTKAKVFLLHCNFSPICPVEVARISRWRYPNLVLWSQAGDSHPAIWSKEVVSAMKSELSLIKQSTALDTVQWINTRKTNEEIFEQTLQIKQFLAISERYLSEKDTKTWLNRLLDKLRKIVIS